jgi:hypothetical protein
LRPNTEQLCKFPTVHARHCDINDRNEIRKKGEPTVSRA